MPWFTLRAARSAPGASRPPGSPGELAAAVAITARSPAGRELELLVDELVRRVGERTGRREAGAGAESGRARARSAGALRPDRSRPGRVVRSAAETELEATLKGER